MPQKVSKGSPAIRFNKRLNSGFPGLLAHEKGLALAISRTGSATWVYRYTAPDGKRRVIKLADAEPPITDETLNAMLGKAFEQRKLLRSGVDPIEQRNSERVYKQAPTTAAATFEQAALDYIAAKKGGWKNPKHRQQWANTLEQYVYPIIGTLEPHAITTDDVLRVLNQKHKSSTLWLSVPETARRVRSRIETVISAAKARDRGKPGAHERWLHYNNPAQWDKT